MIERPTREPADQELERVLAATRRIELVADWFVDSTLAGGYRSAFRGAGIEFEEVREYVPGDDPRAVDWNVTARVGRPFVKKYADERELTVWFAVDVSRSMHAGFGAFTPREAAAVVCGSLALAAARTGDKVGMLAFDGGVTEFVRAGRGRRHALRILRTCLAPPGDSAARTTLGGALDALEQHVHGQRSVVFLLSDFLLDDWSESVRRAARRHDIVCARIRDVEPPQTSGLLRIRDPERGVTRVVDPGAPRARRAIVEQAAARDRATREAFERCNVDWFDVAIPTDDDPSAFARSIAAFLARRKEGRR